ncbi:uncharacterized protein LOC133368038 [Rhineura floridana]|uniref:uncharacterized protein LOC133368038 n=1 Tax=Rhineura floridana TaxID=261503 RepID=UPI002AC83E31|nr:uncharacterized protein LOC133368038 [Rhineura floridana]
MQRLEERFEPKAMSELKEQLAKSILKNAFSFTAQKAQKLYTNQNLKSFLNITGDEKFKKIPQIILDTLFSIDKSNNKREAEVKENIQKETLLKENKPTSSSLAGSTGDCELEIVHENNKETQQNLGIKCAKEADDTEMSKITAENRQSNKEGLQKPVVKYAKDADKMMAEQGPYEKLLLPISKWIKKKREKYHNKNFHLDPIGVREHETYSCFVAEDILRFTYPEDIILRILQDNKYLTSGRKLKKNVEFELQFNMAVLGVKRSEITSPVGDFIVEADCTFAQFEIFFKKVVFEIVLPVLALHNCVKLDVIRKAFIC